VYDLVKVLYGAPPAKRSKSDDEANMDIDQDGVSRLSSADVGLQLSSTVRDIILETASESFLLSSHDKSKIKEEEDVGSGEKERKYVISAIKDDGGGEVLGTTDGDTTVPEVKRTKRLEGDKGGAVGQEAVPPSLNPARRSSSSNEVQAGDDRHDTSAVDSTGASSSAKPTLSPTSAGAAVGSNSDTMAVDQPSIPLKDTEHSADPSEATNVPTPPILTTQAQPPPTSNHKANVLSPPTKSLITPKTPERARQLRILHRNLGEGQIQFSKHGLELANSEGRSPLNIAVKRWKWASPTERWIVI
jgi:hypothetical protein